MRIGFLWTLILLLIICGVFFVGQEVRMNKGPDYNITNVTNQMSWNFTYNASAQSTVENIVYKWVDALGFTFMEVGKWSIEYGFNNPEKDFVYYFDYIKKLLIILLLIAILPFSPYLIGGIYLLVIGIKWVVHKLSKKTRKVHKQ